MLKTIGLIGGMSWESSSEYYRIINESVREMMGGLHSAKILMYSINFSDLEPLQRYGRWQEASELILDAGRKLESAGADMILICSNTGNECADFIAMKLNIPVIHIGDVVGEKIQKANLKKVALIGTKYTMEQNYIKGRLNERYDIEVLIPNAMQREVVNRIIYEELCVGIVSDKSKNDYLGIIESLIQQGAQGVILGCTEIPLLISQVDVSVPVFDTTQLHALAAVKQALSKEVLVADV